MNALLAHKKWLLGLALGALVIAGYFYFASGNQKQGQLTGSGTIEGDKIIISSEIPGRLADVTVEEGEKVQKNEILAVLETSRLRAKVEQAQGQLEVARAQMTQAENSAAAAKEQVKQASLAAEGATEQARGGLEQAEATLRAARVKLEKARRDWERYEELYKEKAITKAEYESAEVRYEAAREQVEMAEGALHEAKAGLMQASAQDKGVAAAIARSKQAEAAYSAALAQVKIAGAVLREARSGLSKATIVAPQEGTIVTKVVNEGETVAPGAPILTLVDTQNLHLIVYLPEKELGRVKVGQRALVRIDSFPNRPLEGKVVKINQEAEFTPKNVHMPEERAKLVYGVKISVTNREDTLKLGMPADAEIIPD